MSTPDRPARERLRVLLAVTGAADQCDAVLDNLPLVLEAAREAGKAEPVRHARQLRSEHSSWDCEIQWRLLAVQNVPEEPTDG